MFQISYNFADIDEIVVCLEDQTLQEHAQRSRSVLIQCFTSSLNPQIWAPLHARICSRFPGAVVTGVTTAGEIYEGKFLLHRTIVIFSFFDTSELSLVSLPCSKGEEEETGYRLAVSMLENVEESEVKGVLLYATTQRMDGAGLMSGMRGNLGSVPVFGAGAASYHNNGESWVLAGSRFYREGVAAVAFRGSELEIEVHDYLGWEPLSREMTVTEIGDPTWIKTLDGIPAAEIYEKYLGIRNDEFFFKNMLEFPLVLNRGDTMLARVPITRDAKKSLHLAADVHVGERVRLAYGNPKQVVIDPEIIRQKLGVFQPQGILLFSCYCRQVYLQDAVNLETEAFQQFAPSSGLYTYGEFYGRGENMQLHNASMVAAAMREGKASEPSIVPIGEADSPVGTKQMELTSRLAQFVSVVVEELEQANREMQHLMHTDRLTGLFNRGKMEDLLSEAMRSTENGETPPSIILLDIDRFKVINDTYGHLCGDAVLRKTAGVLKAHAADKVAAGRWGGEEFLILVRHADAGEAESLAERIRTALEQTDFHETGTVTASFGVTTAIRQEPERDLFKRVDDALYAAKRGGRNRVVVY